MTNQYTIVLWCADAVRFASFAAAHLLHEGVHAANLGRIDDEIPVAIGVANGRRTPVFSRVITGLGLICARCPKVATSERFDYLLTVTSDDEVDAGGAPLEARGAPVIRAHELVIALEATSARGLTKQEVLELFASVSREPVHLTATDDPARRASVEHRRAAAKDKVDLHELADCCQRVVAALAR